MHLDRRHFLAAAGALLVAGCQRSATTAGGRTTAVNDGPIAGVVPRGAWASRPLGDNHQPMAGIAAITLHHTAEHPGMADLEDAEVLRRIERFHRETRGWAGIGYHFIIGRDGTVYEGRPVDIEGAHVSGHNAHNLGVSLLGDGHLHDPPAPQLIALGRLLDDLRRRHAITVDRLLGHREIAAATVCPGDRLFAWLVSYRNA